MAVIEAAVRRQYAELFAAFPDRTYATYGNVDLRTCGPNTRGPAPPSWTASGWRSAAGSSASSAAG